MKIWLNCSYHGLYPWISGKDDHIRLDNAAVVIWLVVKKTYWKIWVRQWEGWHPIYIYCGKKIKAMFQTTNQSWSDMVLHGFACKWNGGEFFGLTPPKKKVWNGWVKCAHYCWARLTWFSDELTRRNLQPMAAHCFVPQLGLSKINRPTWLDQIKKKSIRVIIYG